MENVSKIILKRRGKHGWVIYEYGKEEDNEFTLDEIEELFGVIKKDFPDTDSKKIKVEYITHYTGQIRLRMSFYNMNIPKISSKFIETTSLADFHNISYNEFADKQDDYLKHGYEILFGIKSGKSCEIGVLCKGNIGNQRIVEIKSEIVSKYKKVVVKNIQEISDDILESLVYHSVLMATPDDIGIAVAYNVWRIKSQILDDKEKEKQESDVTEIFNKKYSFISQEELEYRLLSYFSVICAEGKELYIKLR